MIPPPPHTHTHTHTDTQTRTEAYAGLKYTRLTRVKEKESVEILKILNVIKNI